MDEREALGEWARQRIAYVPSWGDWYQCIGLALNGNLKAVTVYNLYSGYNITLSIAGEGLWCRREYLQTCFAYPFNQLKVLRVTGLVASKSSSVLKFDEALGFKREGILRSAIPNDDLVVFGMLKSECRYL